MGGSYFFTVTLRDRKSTVLIDHLKFLREAVRKAREARPFTIEAWVVLPEHMHAIYALPPDDADYSSRWRSIKSHFTHQLAKQISINRNTKGEYALWQRRFWEHTLRDDADFTRHIDYAHYNPVKHGHVKQVKDWPYSSFHRFVAKTVYPLNGGVRIMTRLISISLESDFAWNRLNFPGFRELHPGYYTNYPLKK